MCLAFWLSVDACIKHMCCAATSSFPGRILSITVVNSVVGYIFQQLSMCRLQRGSRKLHSSRQLRPQPLATALEAGGNRPSGPRQRDRCPGGRPWPRCRPCATRAGKLGETTLTPWIRWVSHCRFYLLNSVGHARERNLTLMFNSQKLTLILSDSVSLVLACTRHMSRQVSSFPWACSAVLLSSR